MPQTLYKPLDQPFINYLSPLEEQRLDTPTSSEMWSAAFAETNIISNMIELQNKKEFPPQPNFDLVTSLKAKNLWESPERDNYVGVRSDAELDYRTGRIAKQRHNQDVLVRSGWAGYGAIAAAGLADPTIFIPFLKGPTLVRTAIKSALLVGGTVAAEEAVLRQNQETRTAEDSAFAIGAATILGGVFGGAIHALHPSEVARMAGDMANAPRAATISEPHPKWDEPTSVGAFQVTGEGGKLKSTGNRVTDIVQGQLSKLSPVTRLLEQENAPSHMPNGSPLAREIGGKFSQAGLKVEGNVTGFSAAPGGNIENVIKGYSGNLDTANRGIERAFMDYATDGKPGKVFALTRAKVGAALSNSLMDFPEFKRQVYLALSQGNEHENPHVMKAVEAARKQIDDLYKEATEVKIFSGEEKVKGDKSYVSHLWDTVKIKANENKLVRILAEHYQAKKEQEFAEQLNKLREKQSKAGTFISDVERPQEDVNKLIDQFKEELQKLEDELPFDTAQIQLEAQNLRAGARKLEGENKKATLEMARKVEAEGGETLEKYKAKKAEIRRRLSNLSTARVQVNKRFQAKLDKIDRNEELQLNTMLRAAKQAQKVLALAVKGTDKEVEKALSDLKNMFEKTATAFDNAEEQIVRLTNQQDNAIEGVLEKQDAQMNRLDDLAERIDNVDSFDRAELVKEVDDAAKWLMETHAEINARRAVRNERLAAQAKKLTPEEYQAKIDVRKVAAKALAPDFAERVRAAGGEKLDLEKGTIDFSGHSEQMARDTVNKLKGTERRLAYSDIVQEKRGPELARVLDIPASKVMDFLNTDIQQVLNVYTRTLAADVTVARAFGTSDMSEILVKLTDEQDKAIAAIDKAVDKKGVPLTDIAKEKLSIETNKFYKQARDDIYTLLERARGMRAIPSDPDAASYRLAKTAIELNNVRYMGGAAIASIPDPARIIQRHTLLATFRDGFVPFISAFKEFRLSADEARLAGTANEMVSHARYNQATNVFDDAYRGTIAERGLHFISSKMALLSGLAQWTEAWQKFSSVVINARLLRSIAIINGEKVSAKELQKATEFLASVNITPDIAETIWKTQLTQGIEKVNGVWLPNTELWNVADPNVAVARRAYRAALAGEVDSTVILPGLERPSFADKTMTARLFTQFKSFALASTQKTVMAGLQEHDMAYVNGMVISLALGALSYYLYAVAAGGKTYDTMQKSIEDGNWQLWADEAISRSGQTAIFDSFQRVANRVPVINKVSSFSGGPRTKTIGGGLVDELGGPTLDLMHKLEGIVQGTPEPNRHTAHLARQLLPFQNLFYTRRLLDQIENAAGDAFGLEGKKL